jgi:hypothetical protein
MAPGKERGWVTKNAVEKIHSPVLRTTGFLVWWETNKRCFLCKLQLEAFIKDAVFSFLGGGI